MTLSNHLDILSKRMDIESKPKSSYSTLLSESKSDAKQNNLNPIPLDNSAPQKSRYKCRNCDRDNPPNYVRRIIDELELWNTPCYLLDLNVTKGECDGTSAYTHYWD